MLTLTRCSGESLHIGSVDEVILVTLQRLDPDKESAAMVVTRTATGDRQQREVRNIELVTGETIEIGNDVELALVDLKQEKARIGINAPKWMTVHRLEVYEAIQKKSHRDKRGDFGDGSAGARVPRPSSPKPPSLDVRMKEPPSEVDGAGI